MLARLMSVCNAVLSLLLAALAHQTSLALGSGLCMLAAAGFFYIAHVAHRNNDFVMEDICKILKVLALMTLLMIIVVMLYEWSHDFIPIVGSAATAMFICGAGLAIFVAWIFCAKSADRFIRDLLFDIGKLH